MGILKIHPKEDEDWKSSFHFVSEEEKFSLSPLKIFLDLLLESSSNLHCKCFRHSFHSPKTLRRGQQPAKSFGQPHRGGSRGGRTQDSINL